MSGTQNWSRCSRQTSRSICRHSLRGSTDSADARRGRSSRSCATASSDCAARPLRSGLRVGANGAQALALAHDERRVIGGEREAVGLARAASRRAAWRSRRASSRPGRFLVAAAAVRAGNRQRRPQHLAASTPAIWPKRPSATGNAATRRAMPSRSIASARPRVGWSVPSRRPRGPRLQALRLRIERRPLLGLQRDQVGPRGARKAQLELHAVVDRVERAHRQEVEVLALRIERRASSRGTRAA